MRISLLLALTSLIAGATAASAQPADPPTDPAPPDPNAPPPPPPDGAGGAVGVGVGVGVAPPPPPAQPPEPVSTKEKGIMEDANSGRNWITPTALLPPEGTWSISDFELFLLGVGYSPSDQLHFSATTLLPIVEDMPFWLLLSGKLLVVDQGPLKLAAQGTLTIVSVSDTDIDGNSSRASTWGGSLGGSLTYCIDPECYSHVTGYLAGAFAKESDGSAVPFIFGASAVFKVAKRIRLVFEADTAFVAGEINESIDGFLGWYGVRFTSRNIGVDLGFVRPVYYGDGDYDSPLVMGVPFVSFTYRGLRGD